MDRVLWWKIVWRWHASRGKIVSGRRSLLKKRTETRSRRMRRHRPHDARDPCNCRASQSGTRAAREDGGGEPGVFKNRVRKKLQNKHPRQPGGGIDPVKSVLVNCHTRVRVTLWLLTLVWKSWKLNFMITPTGHQNIVLSFRGGKKLSAYDLSVLSRKTK